MTKKNYAGMSEVSTGDCIMLGLTAPSEHKIVFLGDFDGGEATLTDGRSGIDFDFQLQGKKGSNVLNLVTGGSVACVLYGVKDQTPRLDDDGMKFYVDAPLDEGQMLTLDIKSNHQRVSLKLNTLII